MGLYADTSDAPASMASPTPITSDMICNYGVMGRTKASANEKEEKIGRDDTARSHKKWRKRACGLESMKPVCVELTVLLGRGLNCEVREPALSKCNDGGCGRRLKVRVEDGKSGH